MMIKIIGDNFGAQFNREAPDYMINDMHSSSRCATLYKRLEL